MSARMLDLHDIQGNILKGYGRFDCPKARYVLLAIDDAPAGRALLSALAPTITSAAAFAAWQARRTQARAQRLLQALSDVTSNVALTYAGLRALGLPRATLQSFPEEFAMGMRARCDLLGDAGPSAPTHWDPVWREPEQPHVLISLSGREDSALDSRYEQLTGLVEQTPGVRLLSGHRQGETRDDLPYQSASAIFHQGAPTGSEHFGYIDAIGNPHFKGSQVHEASVIGGGKRSHSSHDSHDSIAGWTALETGEFLLGYRDEAQEFAAAPAPKQLAWNGTFMVWRKLHQNVASFDSYLEHIGREFPGGKEALAAKLAGRWRNGAPLGRFQTQREAELFAEQWSRAKSAVMHARNPLERSEAKRRFSELNQLYTAFDYRDDLAGGRCPLGAHIRRANPRGALGADQTRRRLLRRSLPYGDSQSSRTDYGDHGMIFIAYNASLRRQFEHVQNAWLHSGNAAGLGDEQDPLTAADGGSFVVQTTAEDPRPPFFCNKLPRFVETRGGDYFFVPSLRALRAIAEGNLDPT